LQKRFRYFTTVFFICLNVNCLAQTIIKNYTKDSISHFLTIGNTQQNKVIPSQYDTVIRIALLYFPELNKTKIKIRVKKQASPLTARPNIFACFRKANKRKYIITINNNNKSKFSAILLSNLSFNAQIGVIGHELSHISDYNKRHGIYFIKLLIMHLSKKKMDRFEYNTDLRCIAHGLGYQLLSWSTEVRLKLNLTHWKGIKRLNEQGRERYMNPSSILKVITQTEIYK